MHRPRPSRREANLGSPRWVADHHPIGATALRANEAMQGRSGCGFVSPGRERASRGLEDERMARCDLHVHSAYSTDSGNYALRRAQLGESFTAPETVYESC